MHAVELRRLLSEAAGRPIELRINNNARTLISVNAIRPGPGLRVSVHRLFLEAPAAVQQALLEYVSARSERARGVLRRHIAELHVSEPRPAARAKRRRSGYRPRVYDLPARAAAINAAHFGGALEFGVEWFSPPSRPRRRVLRSVTLGHWDAAARIVRMHPMLDDVFVPPFFFDYVLFHELCHIAVPSTAGPTGRMRHHTRRFLAAEARYPRLIDAMAWQEHNLDKLLARWHRRQRGEELGAPPLPRQPGSSTIEEEESTGTDEQGDLFR